MELKIQDLVMHISIVKEMWNYLEELYLRKNNRNKTFDAIQEIIRSEKGNKTLSQHYIDFNKVYEELKVLFPISKDMKRTLKQHD